MSSGVQFEEESFKPTERKLIEESVSSPLVRFLIRYHIAKSKNVGTAIIIGLALIMFIGAIVFVVLGEMQIQSHTPAFTPTLTQTPAAAVQ